MNARDAYHEATSAIRPLLSGIQTREQLDTLLQGLTQIRYVCVALHCYLLIDAICRQDRINEERLNTVHDPPVVKHKGRPKTQRYTGANEPGRPRGGGGQTQVIRKRPYPFDAMNGNTAAVI